MAGCGTRLKKGQWWHFCGETDMGQTSPALCTKCGGDFLLPSDPRNPEQYHKERQQNWFENNPPIERECKFKVLKLGEDGFPFVLIKER